MFSSQNSQVSNDAVFVEDIFSTYLYTGNGSTQTITNGIDLSTKGGLTWIKRRDAGSGSYPHYLFDTTRGVSKSLSTNDTSATQSMTGYGVTAFGTSGFTVTDYSSFGYGINETGQLTASWTFRKQPKFFDVVTYTGDGTTGRQIAHSLGSAPGCIIVKRTSTSSNWLVHHIGVTSTSNELWLNSTAAAGSAGMYNSITATSDTTFTVSNVAASADANANFNGQTYVAYLFAHNAGGFGLTGTDNVISCGSYTGNGGVNNINLGFEPQYILIKNASAVGPWVINDVIRGITVNASAYSLLANTTDAENTVAGLMYSTATGFALDNSNSYVNASGNTYIYIAIRRPMKTPTSATEVFSPTAYTATNTDNRLVDTGIVTDAVFARARNRTSTLGFVVGDRLRGDFFLGTAVTNAEAFDGDSLMTPTAGYGNSFSAMNGFGVGNDITRFLNYSSDAEIAYAFKRASGFMDVVCYTGTGSARTVAHNLTVVPELIIVKRRSAASNWSVYNNSITATKYLQLDFTGAASTNSSYWNNTTPTTTDFTVGNSSDVNGSASTYVAYLFATCAGVSKVGSYTGTGTTLQVNCGFTGGARFVLIKRTDSTGDWYVWDSARGIVAGNDPYLLLNSTAAEVTSTDYIDTYSAGFEISSTAPAAINASGGTFIFLAIA